jgi:hypothetical protein
MAKRERSEHERQLESQMDLNHLRREARTALELAIVALAPSELVDQLAGVTGLLEAIAELPADSAPVVAIVPTIVTRAQAALADWHKWQQQHLEKRILRG